MEIWSHRGEMVMESKVYYHVSNVPNLKVLEPRISTHGKKWVYATPYPHLALLFGSTKSMGDFDGICGMTSEGEKMIPFFVEAYEGALKRTFQGESCSIYEVDKKDFVDGKTSFSAEVVSEKPVKILKETRIDDLYECLLDLIEKKEIVFQPYSDKSSAKIYNHIKSRIEMFKTYKDKNSAPYKFCMEKFPEILKEVERNNEKDRQ